LKKAVQGIKKKPVESRVSGTGVVHLITNKMRMAGQAFFLDGDDPTALFVPVMNLTQAKSWKGEAYGALFVMGLPSA
jgi:hypothetical protein